MNTTISTAGTEKKIVKNKHSLTAKLSISGAEGPWGGMAFKFRWERFRNCKSPEDLQESPNICVTTSVKQPKRPEETPSARINLRAQV